MTNGQDQSPEEPTRDALLAFYNNGVRNIAFLKNQQWRVTYYITLVYAVLVYLGTKQNLNNIDFGCFSLSLCSITIFTAIAGIGVLLILELSLRNERRETKCATKKLGLQPKDRDCNCQCLRCLINVVVITLLVLVVFAGAFITNSAIYN